MAIIQLRSSDWKDVVEFSSYSGKNLKKSFNVFLKKRLRYNTITGKMYVGNEVVSEFSSKKDIPKGYSREDYIRYMFKPEIDNGASMLSRGFKAN